ncbi:unnamed protein product [Euphydryas editha]|uniref:Uncharacterized protein n=1 Tax=Euphydryas editha TaxID=104508 RepID=A0AAU9TKY9_EUPED|nr:unnamed protein product [Euphydryas editha]
MDVAYAICEVYKNVYWSNLIVRYLRRNRCTGKRKILYLVYRQEQNLLLDHGYGTGVVSCVMTIPEAQGQTYGKIIIVRSKALDPSTQQRASYGRP